MVTLADGRLGARILRRDGQRCSKNGERHDRSHGRDADPEGNAIEATGRHDNPNELIQVY